MGTIVDIGSGFLGKDVMVDRGGWKSGQASFKRFNTALEKKITCRRI